MKLTDVAIRNLKPGDKDINIADSDGLYLRVYKSGSKAFFFRGQTAGKWSWKKLGSYPEMTLAEGRLAAAEAAKARSSEVTTMQALYDSDAMKKRRKELKRPALVEYKLTKYFLPHYGDRLAHTITQVEMSKFFDEMASRAPVQANRVLSDVKVLFNHAETRGWIDRSPVDKLTRGNVGGSDTKRARVMDDDDLKRFIREIESPRFGEATRLMFALLLVTGQRSGEVRGLKKSEVSDVLWTVPEERAKNNVASLVMVNPLHRFLLKLAFKELGSTPFGNASVTLLPRAMTRIGWTVRTTTHDLRRTMATRMADMGVEPYIVEKCLNHKMSGVMAIYNHAEYLPQKKAAWRLWARYLLRLRASAKKEASGEPEA